MKQERRTGKSWWSGVSLEEADLAEKLHAATQISISRRKQTTSQKGNSGLLGERDRDWNPLFYLKTNHKTTIADGRVGDTRAVTKHECPVKIDRARHAKRHKRRLIQSWAAAKKLAIKNTSTAADYQGCPAAIRRGKQEKNVLAPVRRLRVHLTNAEWGNYSETTSSNKEGF